MSVTSRSRLVHPQCEDRLRGKGAEHSRQEKKQPHHFPPACHRFSMGCANQQRSHVLREISPMLTAAGKLMNR